MTLTPITGLVGAPVTPMDVKGEVHYDSIENLAQLYHKNGLSGAFICGSTGEGTSLTFGEKQQIVRTWAEVKGTLRTLVNLGGTCLKDMQALAELAQEEQLDGIAIMCPYYFKPSSLEQLVKFAQEVASAAPELPFYYYHIPVLSGGYFSMKAFLEIAGDKIPTLAGIKYTYSDLYDYQQARAVAGGRYNVLWGTDEALLSGWAAGARGAVGSTYNYAAPLYHKIIQAFENGALSEAQALQDKAVEMVRLLIAYGGNGATKAFMKIIGLDCGSARLPLSSPSSQEIDRLEKELERMGFFEFCCKC